MDSYRNNVLAWGLFMTSSMKAANRFGRSFQENLEITQKLVKEQLEENLNVKTLDYQSPSWTRSALCNDKVIEWAKAKVCVYADSVLCLGKVEQDPGAA